jgi:hypothetical protein
MQEKSGKKRNSDIGPEKARYRPPELIRFGLVKDLTAEGSGRHPENQGADEANNKRRFP